jgi:hypothetical protein
LKYSEKTIPYRLSAAELENLRILRERTHSSRLMLAAEMAAEKEKGSSEEADVCRSEPDPLEKKTLRKSL